VGNTSPEQILIPPTCSPITYGTKGLWYRVAPPPNQLISIAICGACFDTTLTLYGPGCSGDSCLLFSDDSLLVCSTTTCADSADRWSSISFCSSEPEYFIHVSGYFSYSEGEFTLVITNDGSCNPTPNGLCKSANTINQFPASIDFTVRGKSYPDNYCQLASYSTSNAASTLWYHISGTGASFLAHTCNSDFETELGVLSGSVEENLQFTIIFYKYLTKISTVIVPL
jgi:hypothetical protein